IPSAESVPNADRWFASSSYHKAKTQPAQRWDIELERGKALGVRGGGRCSTAGFATCPVLRRPAPASCRVESYAKRIDTRLYQCNQYSPHVNHIARRHGPILKGGMSYAKLRRTSKFSSTVRRRETIEGLNHLLHIGWKRLYIFLKLPGRGVMETQGPRIQHHAG